MRVYTIYKGRQKDAVRRISRRTTTVWEFLISGEWSDAPGHSGDYVFSIRHSADRRSWSLLLKGFPNRIVAGAETDDTSTVERVGAAMLRALDKDGGPCIELVTDYGVVDLDEFWSLYEASGS